jgi:signal peptidase II
MKNKFYFVALVVMVLDLFTKWLMTATLLNPHRTIELIPEYLRFSYVTNTGVAFGIFRDSQASFKPYILGGLAVIAVMVIIIYGSRTPQRRILLQVALNITMGGILGNFIDRINHGYVVDFIEFHIRDSFYWPTFNLADSAITVGVALLFLDAIKNSEPEKELAAPVTGEK